MNRFQTVGIYASESLCVLNRARLVVSRLGLPLY